MLTLFLELSEYNFRSKHESQWTKPIPRDRRLSSPIWNQWCQQKIPMLLVDGPCSGGAQRTCAHCAVIGPGIVSEKATDHREKNVSVVLSCAKPRGDRMLSLFDHNHHVVGKKKAVRNKAPVAKRSPGYRRVLLWKLARSWLHGKAMR